MSDDPSVYRPWLERGPGNIGTMVFVMLNPSTADEKEDDPTIRRCLGFMRREGLDRLVVANLFTRRATNPHHLIHSDDPVGPEANDALDRAIQSVEDPAVLKAHFPDAHPGTLVCAWGAFNGAPDWFLELRRMQVARVVDTAEKLHRPLWCLGTTKDGSPRHPLYVAADAPLVRYRPVL